MSGWKFNQYELQGVPLRIAIGPKDLEKGMDSMLDTSLGGRPLPKRRHIGRKLRKKYEVRSIQDFTRI